uniref:Uncharacterized protein n=1 Tax=Anopheles farauti TaxID=69004 RepID=A0A182Q5N9_9DIPT
MYLKNPAEPHIDWMALRLPTATSVHFHHHHHGKWHGAGCSVHRLLHPAHDGYVGQLGIVLGWFPPGELLHERLPVALPALITHPKLEQPLALDGHIEPVAYALPGVANVLALLVQPVARNDQTLHAIPGHHHPVGHGFAEPEHGTAPERADIDEPMLDRCRLLSGDRFVSRNRHQPVAVLRRRHRQTLQYHALAAEDEVRLPVVHVQRELLLRLERNNSAQQATFSHLAVIKPRQRKLQLSPTFQQRPFEDTIEISSMKANLLTTTSPFARKYTASGWCPSRRITRPGSTYWKAAQRAISSSCSTASSCRQSSFLSTTVNTRRCSSVPVH